ncbi:hypothetical protein M409DRAFT_52852 [Zasmidium cellare ATCC 36951]|uniref:Carbohydrate-binding module family 19 domain-containing protein n=1 Tax=Zasmidium cellare ATCC 36951 TaxID=1080233 RepID=A0A6A6CP62_ZASCE|nr:uncharacterized protein M409DRAFT_52852 [Zasmidium cellare ATCC 36951]KAF2168851.1 hypothetical protein M409DRAFT_52852 [Zasmidium cellare ATCC 36951]
MKSSIFAGLIGLTILASAAPADNIRRANDIGHEAKAPLDARQVGYPYPTGTGLYTFRPIPYPTGYSSSLSVSSLPPIPYPTGVAPSYPPVPVATGSSTCPVDGAVVCNGPNLFGLCNFGHVVWQSVALGTACEDGKIVGTGIYAVPGPTAVASSYKA